MYEVAQRTIQCYIKSTNYTLLVIDLDSDPRVLRSCGRHDEVFFRKHCAVALYLPETDWMLVLDADTGVVNPNHCIEEWIDDSVDVILYERIFNWEIMAGNYLMLLLEVLIPECIDEYHACEEYWVNATDYESYMAVVVCVRMALGARRIWPGKIRIYRRFGAFARDGWATHEWWSEEDFMFHGWKENSIEEFDSPFEREIDLRLCGRGLEGWKWKEEKKKSIEEIREEIIVVEQFYREEFPKEGRVHPFIDKLSVAGLFAAKLDRLSEKVNVIGAILQNPKLGPASRQQRNLRYTKQKNSDECAHTYGRVMILVMYTSADGKTFHGTAQRTLECYATSKKYELVQVDIDINERIRKACSKHKVIRKSQWSVQFLQELAEREFQLKFDWWNKHGEESLAVCCHRTWSNIK
ncbi:hypothetical protein ANCCEY_00700 [Ancylostoma ceylanicum]|uniref:Uncharacterized protein n=1 Tax=Ancylostoma ceylanicum TaxID=53326 RepID=A0A0D6M7P7_9BILA|nr:hypothetical protein ANCCEY_00700 [Ancylostoma ceylanicum]